MGKVKSDTNPEGVKIYFYDIKHKYSLIYLLGNIFYFR